MEPLKVCRPVVADFHHFDKEQDSDPHKYDGNPQHQVSMPIKLFVYYHIEFRGSAIIPNTPDQKDN